MFKQKSKILTSVKRVSLLAILAIVIAASFVVAFSRQKSATAATNSTINFQARLLTAAGNLVPDGDYNVEFKLYNALSSAGSSQGSCSGDSACLWTETRTTTNRVRTVNGYMTVNLGSVTSFPSINWDQELWLTMNIGGTPLTPSWDGEMNPRLKLTSVPYAFRAGALVGGTGANTTTLNTGTPSGTNTIQLPAESGTICLQSSVACGFLTGSAADYIQNQNASSQTTANFWISGTGRADTSLQAPLLDTATATALNVGTTNATAINLNQNTTIATSKTLTVTSGATSLTGDSTGDALTVSNATSTGNIAVFKDNTTTVATIANGGAVAFTNTVNSEFALQVQNAAGGNVLSVNTSGTAAPVTIGRAGVSGHAGAVLTGIYQDVSSNNQTFSFNSNVPAGSTIVGSLALSSTTVTTATITDTKGNTYSVDASITSGSVTTGYVFSGRITNALTASDTLTIDLASGTGRWLVSANAYDNLLTPAVDQISTNTATNTAMTTGATPTTTNANELVYATFSYGSGRTFTPEAGFTAIAQQETTAGSNDRAMASEWKYVTSTGAQTATATLNSSGVYASAVVTYKSMDPSLTGLGGAVRLSDGTTNNRSATLGTNNLTADRSILLSDESGTICIQNSTNCGFAAASGSANYIHNGTALQTANFYVQSAATNSVGGIIRGAAGQTSSLLQLLDGTSGLTVAQFTNNGYLHLGSDSIARTGQITFHDGTTSNTNTITLIAPAAVASASKTITLPDETGTLCIQSSTSCGFAAGSGDADYIQNGTTVQTANFSIRSAAASSVSGIIQGASGQSVDIFQVQTWNGTSATTALSVGSAGLVTAHAGLTVSGNLNHSTGTISLASNGTASYASTGAATITAGAASTWSTSSGDLTVQAATTSTLNLRTGGAGTVAVGDVNTTTINIGRGSDIARSINIGTSGTTTAQAVAIGSTGSTSSTSIQGGTGDVTLTSTDLIIAKATTSLQIQNASNDPLLYADTANGRVGIGGQATFSMFEVLGGDAAIYNSGNNPRLILGDSTAGGQNGYLQWDSTNNYFRIESVGTNGLKINDNFVAIGNIFPSQPLIVGNGSTNLFQVNTTGSVLGKTSTDSTTGFQIQDALSNPVFDVDTDNVRVGIGNNAPNYTLDVTGDVNISTGSSYRINGTAICTSSGCTPAAGSANYIQNQNAGQQAASSFWISGTGRADTSLQAPLLDTATAAALNIGTTNATAINLNKSVTVTGSLNQSTGTISLASNGTASYVSTGATTITAGAASTWSTSAGGLTVQAATTNILSLQTGGAGTVALGNVNTTTIDIGRGSNIARTIRIGDAGSSTAQTITMGSTGSTSSTTIQGGTGSTAINLTGGTNGSINLTASGSGNINLTAAANVIINTPTFSTATTQNCASNCTITQANVDGNGAVVINATATAVTVTLADPTITTAGRIVYVTAAGASNDFTLSVNGGGTGNLIAMRANTSATMIWNGTDWTAAGASSSTTLQAAYDNTLASAGGAEIVLNNTATSNGLTIRNGSSNPIIGGGLLEVQTSIGTNLFSVNNNISELVANGGAEDSSTFSTNWQSYGTATVARNTTSGQYATGAAGAQFASTTANSGIRNNLATNPAVSTNYLVSFTAKLASGSPAFADLIVQYSPNGGTTLVTCIQDQTIVSTDWTRITCEVNTGGTAVSNADLLIYQVADPGASTRTVYIDNLSMTLADDAGGIPNNVQIGGGIYGGAPTLFTLDRSSAPPVANLNTTYYGSMYFDTTSGRIQCYESDGWGACGSAPDNFIVLTPEYSNAVLAGPGTVNGVSTATGIGTLTADFCANQSSVLEVNTSFCASGLSRNYYRWTSPQATPQTYSIYVSYKLPSTFKEFYDNDTIKLTALKDHATNAGASLEVFRSTGSGVSQCGSTTTITTSTSSWVTTSLTGNEQSCSFAESDTVIFKINITAQNNANVYIENLEFRYTNL